MIFIKKIFSAIILFLTFNLNVSALEGIDVSIYQDKIDFSLVKRAGIDVVYIRSSAGNSYVDPNFLENYNNAKANNLKIGVYHFVTARNTEEAIEQATFFASLLEGKNIDCRLAMDFEVFGNLSREEINDISRTFLETLSKLTNKELVIYSDAYNANNTFYKDLFDDYPLWVAEYGVDSPIISNYIGWQYTDKGEVEGINTYVDRDYFTNEIYLSDSSTIKTITPEKNTKTIYYHVKSGDTLSYIASIYNVTINDLISWNNIKNPNLIYPNEVIIVKANYKYNISTKNDYYIVKKGDTLSEIAYSLNVSLYNLIKWNDIINPNLIYPNERLLINKSTNNHLIKYVVKSGDTLSLISLIYKVPISKIASINNIQNINFIRVGQIIYIPEEDIY